VKDLAFSYSLTSEVVPYGLIYSDVDKAWGNPMAPNLTNNLHQVRLVFRWPLLANNSKVGPGGQGFSTLVGGYLAMTNAVGDPTQPQYNLYFFQPRTYVKVP
jgi:hypothetical protein